MAYKFCPVCKYKFSSNNRVECPKCDTPIEKTKYPVILHYVYYHCTKRVHPNCTQGSIEVKELERRIDRSLSGIQISEDFKNWAIKYLKEANDEETASRENLISSQRKAYDSCLKKLENLFQLKISPLNTNGNLLSDEEYAKQKAELMKEKARLEEFLNDGQGRVERCLEIGEKTFEFARNASYWFADGSSQEKGQILQTLGSNLILKDKKLQIQLKEPFAAIGRIVERVPAAKATFEPNKTGQNERNIEVSYFQNPLVRWGLDEVRTWIMKNSENFDLPAPAELANPKGNY